MTKAYVLRYASFVAFNVAAATGMTYFVCQTIPPLRNEYSFVTIPVAVLSFFVCLTLYPILNRQKNRLRQLAAFYLGFNALLCGFGIWLFGGTLLRLGWQSLPMTIGQAAITGVGFGHWLGLIPFLILVALNAALRPFFFPRSPLGA